MLFYLLQVNSRVIPTSSTVTFGDGRVIQIVVKAGKNDPSEKPPSPEKRKYDLVGNRRIGCPDFTCNK